MKNNTSIFQELGKRRLNQLDGLRGICSLVVLITHLIGGAYIVRQNLDFYPSLLSLLLKSICSLSHISVLIFFVLSGFVIGYTTPIQFTHKEAKNYVARRLIRLYPIYIFALLLTFALAEESYNVFDIVCHLFFLQGWLVPVAKSNLPLWSLHYEFIFYFLFLAVWKFQIKISKAIFICALAAILSAYFKFHIFEIFGYFTLWLSGLWLSWNITTLKFITEPFASSRFLPSCILMAAYSSQNIIGMVINKFGTSSSVLSDTILTILATATVASLIVEYKMKWYKLTFTTILLINIVTLIYAWKQHTFFSTEGLIFGYQSVAFFLILLPISYKIKIPISRLLNARYIGSFSYALYVIHFPILVGFYRIISIDNLSSNLLIFWGTNAIALVISLVLAWFLECYLHVKIAKSLKTSLKL